MHRLAARITAARDGRPARQPRVRSADDLCEAPVEDVDLAEVAEHDVAGLEVAVDDAARVGEVDGLADAGEGGEELAPRELADGVVLPHAQRVDDALEGHPADALHREVQRAVGIAAEVVDGDDGRVLELPLHARLPEEPRAGVAVRAAAGLHALDGDVAPDAAVDAGPHDAHPALAEGVAHVVARPEGVLGEDVRGQGTEDGGVEGRRGERVSVDGEG